MPRTPQSPDPEQLALDQFELRHRIREPRQSKVADAFDAFLSAEAEEREFHRNMKAMLEDALGLADEETE